MVIIQLHPVITTNIKANKKQGKNIKIFKYTKITIVHKYICTYKKQSDKSQCSEIYTYFKLLGFSFFHINNNLNRKFITKHNTFNILHIHRY